jgi:hypothetical protein
MPGNRNLDLPDALNALLDDEKELGTSITRTVSAALFWYFNRLEASQRELAREECRQWVKTGKLPSSAIATQMEEALRSARALGSRRSPRRSGGRE